MKLKLKLVASTSTLVALLAACSSQETVIGMDPIFNKHGGGGGGCVDGYVYASDNRCYPSEYYPDYTPGEGDGYDSPSVYSND